MNRIYLLIVIFFCSGLLMAQDQKADEQLAKNNFAKARAYQAKYKLDSAEILFNKAGEIFNKYSKWDNYIVCQILVNDIRLKKAEFKKALTGLQNIEQLAIQHFGDTCKRLPEIYKYEGLAYFYTSEFDKSIEYYNKSLNITRVKEGTKNLKVAELYNNLGNTFSQKGDYKQALENYTMDYNLRKEVQGENHPDLALPLTSMAVIYQTNGEYDKALENNNKALELRLKAGQEKLPETGVIYNNIGSIYIDKGEYDQALQYIIKSLQIKKGIYGDKHPEIASSYSLLARIYKEKSEFDKALENYNVAYEILNELLGESSNEVAEILLNQGLIYRAKNNHDAAIKVYDKALLIKRKIFGDFHPTVAAIYNNMGIIYDDQKKDSLAIIFYRKAIEIDEKVYGSKNPNLVNPYLNLGSSLNKRKESFQALEYYQKSIVSNVKDFNPEVSNLYANPSLSNIYFDQYNLLNALNGKAAALKSKYDKDSVVYDLETAYQTFLLCDTLINVIRKSTTTKADKLLLGKKANEIFENTLSTLFAFRMIAAKNGDNEKEKFYLKKAFYFSERSKAGTLLEAIAGAEAQKFSGIPDSLLMMEKAISEEIALYENQLSQLPGPEEEKTFRNKLFDLNKKYQSLIKKFEKDYPNYYEMKYSNRTTSAEDIQNILNDSTAIFSYFLSEEQIIIFTITSKTINFRLTEKPADLDANITKIRGMLTSGKAKDVKEYQQFSFNLFNSLFPDTIPLNIKNLIIIPYGELGLVPFEALLTEKYSGDQKNYKEYPFLIKKYSVCYSYSANLYYHTFPKEEKQTRSRPASDFLGLAPVFAQGNDQEFNGAQVLPLPGTLDEVNQIRKEFDNKKLKTLVQINKAASETYLRQGITKDYKFLHIATHGFVDPNNPESSGFLLSKDSAAINDGILYARDIYNLALNADMVVLSACETGLGKVISGEGIIGMNQAILYAGTKNIIVSLWKVSDISTTYLMIDFYNKMLNSPLYNTEKMSDFAGPLRQAKLKMIAEGKFAHPFFWSPFILIGK